MTETEHKLAKEIRWLKKCFRCLCKWRITFHPRAKNRAECRWSTEPIKTAHVAGYGQDRVPCDYALHEMLHLAFAEFRTVRGGKTRRAFEEILIRDICKVYRQARSHK